MKTLFEDIENNLPSGLKEEFCYKMYSSKKKLKGVLDCLNSELERNNNSNIRNSKDWVLSLLEDYKHTD